MEPTTVELPKVERRSSAPVKRRVSRACDHCHRMRTRCNGQAPCSRCIELEYVCQYQREKKRRGKVSLTRLRLDCESANIYGHLTDPMFNNVTDLLLLLSRSPRRKPADMLTDAGTSPYPKTKRGSRCCGPQSANAKWSCARQWVL